MTEGLKSAIEERIGGFRLEISDFGAFYERTYDTAYRTALGIVRIQPSPPTSPRRPTSPPTATAIVTGERRHRRRGCTASSSTRRCRPCAGVAPPAGARPVALDGAGYARVGRRRLALLQALDVLPARQRAAVILRYYHDYDYATIAQILSTTSTNVGAMLSRALDRLKEPWNPAGRRRRNGRLSHETDDLERAAAGALRETLDRELGPDPIWDESPAARRVAEPTCRRSRWTLRVLAVAALISAGGAAALLAGAPNQPAAVPNGWIAYTWRTGGRCRPDLSLTSGSSASTRNRAASSARTRTASISCAPHSPLTAEASPTEAWKVLAGGKATRPRHRIETPLLSSPTWPTTGRYPIGSPSMSATGCRRLAPSGRPTVISWRSVSHVRLRSIPRDPVRGVRSG